jgi:hypothetical protein
VHIIVYNSCIHDLLVQKFKCTFHFQISKCFLLNRKNKIKIIVNIFELLIFFLIKFENRDQFTSFENFRDKIAISGKI